MTIITIGRGPENKILIDEPEISRLHAMVKVDSFGKLWIIDKSSNGTYINGIKIARDVSVPVSRKDDVSFAKVRHLDWTRIPDPAKKIKIGALAVLGLIALVAILSIVIPMFKSSPAPVDNAPLEQPSYNQPVAAVPDTTSKQKPTEGKEENKTEQKKDDSKSSETAKSEKEKSSKEATSENNSPDWAKRIVEKEAAQKRAAEAAKKTPKPSTVAPKPAEPAKKQASPAKKKPTESAKPAQKQDNTQNRIL